MSTVVIEVPDDSLIVLREQPKEFADDARLVTAPHHLREKRLSLGQAARLAGMNRRDFMDALTARGVPGRLRQIAAVRTPCEGIPTFGPSNAASG